MATRSATRTVSDQTGRITINWGETGAFIGSSDNGTAQGLPPGYDWLVQAGGTLGTGGVVSLEYSLDGGTTWGIGGNPAGTALTMDAIGECFQLAGSPPLVRPAASAGDGSTAFFVRLVGTPVRH